MDHFAGLDVSVKETSVCIVDETGRTVREVKVPSEPDALLPVLANPAYHFKRIGLEAACEAASVVPDLLLGIMRSAAIGIEGIVSLSSIPEKRPYQINLWTHDHLCKLG